MKTGKRYFTDNPSIFILFMIMIPVGAAAFLSKSNLAIIGCVLLSIIVPGLEPLIVGYRDRVELKRKGVLFFLNKTIRFNDIEEVHLTHTSFRDHAYLFKIKQKQKEKEIKVRIRRRENVLVFLHLLTESGIKLISKNDDYTIKNLYHLMEKERESETFDLDSRQYKKPSLFLELWFIAVILMYVFYLYKY